jgi:hypothetical protein
VIRREEIKGVRVVMKINVEKKKRKRKTKKEIIGYG